MSANHQRIKAIDGLRALAVICVLLYHLFPRALPGGFVGVDIFFLISGYVVCGSLLKTPIDSVWSFAGDFYARRVLRIYPAGIAVLLVVGVLSRLFIPDSHLATVSQNTGITAFFGLSNFQLYLNSNSYFAPTGDANPYLHTWSLAVEEQFYFVFPLLLFLCLRSKQTQNLIAARLTSALLPALFCLSLVCSSWETSYRHDSAYYLLPSRFWELALGALLCLEHSQGRFLSRSPSHSRLLLLMGLAGIALSLCFTDAKLFPFPWAIAPTCGTACCIAGVVVPAHANLASAILSSRPVTYIGRISYSLYLWHWPVIVLLRWTIGLEYASDYVIAILSTGLLATLSYHLIEIPFQSFRLFHNQWTQLSIPGSRGSHENRKVLLALPTNLAFVGVGIGVILLCCLTHAYISLSANLPLSVTMRRGNPWRLHSRGIANRRLGAGAPGLTWSGKRLFVLGDSHARYYSDMVSQLQEKEGVSVYMYTSGGIRIGSLVFPQGDPDRAAERSALKDLEQYARPGDIVLLTSLRVLRLGNQWETFDLNEVIAQRDSEQAENDRQVAVREGKELIRKLEGLGLVVLIEAPKPVFVAPAFRCCDWFNRMNPIGRQGFVMQRDFLLEHRSAAMRSIAEVQQEFPKVRVWDPLLVLSTGATCAAFEGDKPLFFDNDHLSSYGNQRLYPDFVNQIRAVWGTTASLAERIEPAGIKR